MRHAGRVGSGAGLIIASVVGGVVLSSAAALAQADSLVRQRAEMVQEQIRDRGIEQPEVLAAMAQVPRHLFVPEQYRRQSYDDKPLPIGWGQNISQPYIVAFMTELLDLDGDEKVLEIGTGSGYHAAVLSRIAPEVYSIEINEELGRQAQATLESLGFDNIVVRIDNGYNGWPEKAPFDAVILTTAPRRIPDLLLDQLRVGGRMVVPVGSYFQDLLLILKTEDGIVKRTVAPVRFRSMSEDPKENDSEE